MSVAWPTRVQMLVFFCSNVPVVLFDTPGVDRCWSQIEDIWFFQCKIKFYFTQWTPKVVFSRVFSCVEIQVLVFMSEIKFDLTLKKIKFSVSFMLLFAIIELLPIFRLSHQKTNFFSCHFVSIKSCSACLGGIVLGKNTVLYLENEPK